MHHLQVGKQGEKLACKFLKKRGYKILTTNYRCPLGEVDVVASCGSFLVFIEVKTRSSDEFGPPQLAVTGAKQRQIIKAARFYLKEHGINNRDCRFDVVAVSLNPKGKPLQTELIPNAFTLNG